MLKKLFLTAIFGAMSAAAQADECTPTQQAWLAQVHPSMTLVNAAGAVQHLSERYDASICKVWPAHPEFTIMVNGWTDGGVDVEAGDLEVLLFDSATGALKNRYVAQGALESDAVYVSGLQIDTALYALTPDKMAFGVRVSHRGSSRPNPFGETRLTLFVPQGSGLVPVAKDLQVEDDGGEWDTNCAGIFQDTKSIIKMQTSRSHGYYDFSLLSRNVITKNVVKNGECVRAKVQKRESATTQYRFDGKEYKAVRQPKAFTSWYKSLP
jgi:hypothetical protein